MPHCPQYNLDTVLFPIYFGLLFVFAKSQISNNNKSTNKQTNKQANKYDSHTHNNNNNNFVSLVSVLFVLNYDSYYKEVCCFFRSVEVGNEINNHHQQQRRKYKKSHVQQNVKS